MKETRRQPLGFYFFPGTKGFHIVAKLGDVPGALYGVLGLLHERVDFVNSTSYSLGDGSAIWSGFGKSLLKDETKEKLKELIERSPLVLECEVEQSAYGLLIDSFHSGVDIAPDRPGIVFPAIGIARVYDRLAQTFGSGGEMILFEEGSALGRSTGQYLNARLGHAYLDWKIKALLGMYWVQGWGSASLEVERPNTRFRVTVRDDFECAGGGKDRKGCGFLRGHLTSTISTLSGREFEGEETKCKFRGDSFCEFLLSRKEA
ncbi:MAG: V4R domain-containing protein [Nitrososphaerales archaeon]|jgi:predicted hydrocarbon binding protein